MDAISLPLCLKATPKLEGGQRLIYCEPSNESTDLDGERVLREALKDSADYFLAKGNFDLDHMTLLGYSQKLENPREYEIGRPLEVKFDHGRTFVKGFIYSGDKAKRANEFWETLTEYQPPMPWYPSVGGHVRDRGVILPKGESQPVKAIKKVYWNNIGFSREPVNSTVPGVTTVPLGAFAKSWIGAGSTLEYERVEKAITAGYGTDSATLAGGGALRKESLHGVSRYQVLSGKVLNALRKGQIQAPIKPDTLIEYLMQEAGVSQDEAESVIRRLAAQITTLKQGARS